MKRVNLNNRIITILLASTITLIGCSRIGNIESNVPENTNIINTIEETTENIEVDIKEIVTKEAVNLRKEASTDSETIDIVPENTTLNSINQVGDFYEVFYNDEIGFISKEYAYEAITKEGINKEQSSYQISNIDIEVIPQVQATTTVNIRKDATTESNVIATLGEGQKLEVIRLLNNGWYEVKYNNEIAYINSEYVKETQEERINTPFNKIAMFNKESNIYDINTNEIIEEVPTYEVAYIYDELDNKLLVSVNNKICYINKEDVVDLPNKVVIVDISDQHAILYNGNEIVVDTPIVSGNASSTPSDIGYFDIDWKDRNCYLTGPGYKSYVDYWMPYNGGEGLHDAEYHTDYDENGNVITSHGWRDYSDFGRDTYQYNGSHGCINLPHEAAVEIYNNVDYGTNVLVKK